MIVNGPLIEVHAQNAQTGAPLAGVTITPSAYVYTSPDMGFAVAVSTLTTDALGNAVAFATPGTYTFTCSDSSAAPIEEIQVIGTGVVQGAQGAVGAQGPAGAAGAQGAQGAVGSGNGPQGAQGSQGAAGAQGAQGAAGFIGSNGAQGAQGAAGAQGASGAQGAQGTINSLTRNNTVQTASFTATANTFYDVSVSAGNVIVTLPSDPAAGTIVGAVITAWAASNAMSFAAGSGDTFESGTNPSRGVGVGQLIMVEFDHTNRKWFEISDRWPLALLDGRYVQPSTLAAVATSGAASDLTGAFTLTTAPPSSTFRVLTDGSGGWQWNNGSGLAATTTRPSARTDIYMDAVGGASAPSFMLPGDTWDQDTS